MPAGLNLTWNCWHDLHEYCAGAQCQCTCHPVTRVTATPTGEKW